jgi:hypothetical protein
MVRDGLVQHPAQAHLAVWSAVLADAGRSETGSSASGDNAARLVLIVDQFEQVFTLNPGREGEPGRQAFITALCAAASRPAGPKEQPAALVVIAVRGDFWDRCAAYPRAPLNDSWIAATAIAHGVPVVTQDSAYDAVPDVRVIKI